MERNFAFKNLTHVVTIRRIITINTFKQFIYRGAIYFLLTFLYLALCIF